MSDSEQEAAAVLRRQFATVKFGDIAAPPGRGVALQRRWEGAVAALEMVNEPTRDSALGSSQDGVRVDKDDRE
jgi:hypothetical protein